MKIIICINNCLSIESRTLRQARAIHGLGWDVQIFGTLRPGKQLSASFRKFKVSYISPFFYDRGLLFFPYFMLRMALFLFLSTKPDLYQAIDAPALIPVCLASFFKRRSYVYDCREILCETPSLVNTNVKKHIWFILEKTLIKKAKKVFVTYAGDGEYLQKVYGRLEIVLVRNVCEKQQLNERVKAKLCFPEHMRHLKIALHLGSLSRFYGVENAIAALKFLSDYGLVIIGSGPLLESLRELAFQSGYNDRIYFMGQIPAEKINAAAADADIGLICIEPHGKSFENALPNKLFEYIQARIPIVARDLPAIREILHLYGIGDVYAADNAESIAESILKAYDLREEQAFITAIEKASNELCWEKECVGYINALKAAI